LVANRASAQWSKDRSALVGESGDLPAHVRWIGHNLQHPRLELALDHRLPGMATPDTTRASGGANPVGKVVNANTNTVYVTNQSAGNMSFFSG
jgi:hypothetical protein